MLVVELVTRASPLPPPFLACAVRHEGLIMVAVAEGVSDADATLMGDSMAEEMFRRGMDVRWRLSVE
jgi:hypothetical protein